MRNKIINKECTYRMWIHVFKRLWIFVSLRYEKRIEMNKVNWFSAQPIVRSIQTVQLRRTVTLRYIRKGAKTKVNRFVIEKRRKKARIFVWFWRFMNQLYFLFHPTYDALLSKIVVQSFNWLSTIIMKMMERKRNSLLSFDSHSYRDQPKNIV